MAAVIPTDGMLFLAELLRRGLPLKGVVHLFTGPLIPNSNTRIVDFTEASFNGYVPQPIIAWQPAFLLPNGSALLSSDPVSWISLAISSTPPVTGYWIEQTDWALVNRLVSVERFGTGIPFFRVGVSLTIYLPLAVNSLF